MKKLRLVRVTEVLDWVDSHWKQYWYRAVGFEQADKISRESSEFGRKVHKLVEDILQHKIEISIESEVPEEKCAIEIIMWMEQNNVAPLIENSYEKSMEIEVSDKKLGLVGHFDFAALYKGIPFIVDFKTSNKMRKSFALQMSAYAKMSNSQLGTNINDALTIRCHWNKEEKKCEFETEEYYNLSKCFWPKFKACLVVWTYFNRGGK